MTPRRGGLQRLSRPCRPRSDKPSAWSEPIDRTCNARLLAHADDPRAGARADIPGGCVGIAVSGIETAVRARRQRSLGVAGGKRRLRSIAVARSVQLAFVDARRRVGPGLPYVPRRIGPHTRRFRRCRRFPQPDSCRCHRYRRSRNRRPLPYRRNRSRSGQ